MVCIGECARTDVFRVIFKRFYSDVDDVAVPFREFRLERVESADQIVPIEQLAGAGRTSAYREGEDRDRVIDRLANLVGNGLDFHSDRPRLLDRLRIVDNLKCVFRGASLHFETAISVHEMRAEADVTHDRDASVRDRLDDVKHLAPALEFYGIDTAFLHDSDGVLNGDVFCGVGAVRHGDQRERVWCAASDGFGVLYHLVYGHGEGVFMPV